MINLLLCPVDWFFVGGGGGGIDATVLFPICLLCFKMQPLFEVNINFH